MRGKDGVLWWSTAPLLLALLVVAALGEGLQAAPIITHGSRQASWADFVANVVGIVGGWGVWWCAEAQVLTRLLPRHSRAPPSTMSLSSPPPPPPVTALPHPHPAPDTVV